ncbi:MAG TPA: Gfo/Idh/MocA family oxidoreductase [Verrucomicrobiae bacterium]|nr:Gfo/Idh/MocA family oxidoreductase [Verrucomicrobiae bacterium]
MKRTDRRRFLKQSAALATGAAAWHISSGLRAQSPNEKFILGIIGPGGMGTSLLKSFAGFQDVDIASVSDVDERRLAAAVKNVEGIKGKAPRAEGDFRRILEDKAVDAVVIATPDHWHAPATILACDAGKHVYVEKPGSHNIREGRLMIEAARRNKRVVQVGTQSRSTVHVRDAIDKIRGGAIGEVLTVRVWNSQLRASIGKRPPSQPPPGLDFDAWVGPAPMVAYRANLLPHVWRWWFAFGTGDMGNDGVHDLDLGRWGLGVGDRHPNRVCALGGKYFFDDDQQFPDTQTVVFEYGLGDGQRKQLIYEQRLWAPYVQEGHENGDGYYGTKGYVILGKGEGWELFAERNKPVCGGAGKLDLAAHNRNFLDCIKTGARPNADVEVHHYSACLCHLGNIATRLGRALQFDPAQERFIGDDEANGLVRREYRAGHWAVPRGV